MGLDHTSEIRPYHAVRRVSEFQALAFHEIYDFVKPGALIEGTAPARFQGFWNEASAESSRPWSAAEKRQAASACVGRQPRRPASEPSPAGGAPSSLAD